MPGRNGCHGWQEAVARPGSGRPRAAGACRTQAFAPLLARHVRRAALTDPVRERLLALPRESEWTFTTLRGTHYTPSSRSHHWDRVRCAAGLGRVDLYTATRHYFAWYALNVLDLPPHVIALQLGHRDGGGLVRTNDGHPDAAIARERIRAAFRPAPAVVALPARTEAVAS